MKEIGSEFWDSSPFSSKKIFLLSGRTALDYIIQDIKKYHIIKTVFLPSYCCHTMIEPFLRHNISVKFYDIYADTEGLRAQVPEIQDGTIFYCMTYFGFTKIDGIDIKEIRESAEVIIEDQTHSWLTGRSFEGVDYCYVSYRKWAGFDAIAMAEKCCDFFDEFPSRQNEKYCSMRRKAMEMKKNFIEYGLGDKQEYLNLFAEAEELLEKDYVGYAPKADTVAAFYCFDAERVKAIRRRNAEILIESLKDIPEIQLMFPAMEDDDAPLFVPILVPYGRNELRKYLIANSIYCPIHWPLSDLHRGISSRAEIVYDQELSLICDQRYEPKDMLRIADRVKEFFKQ